VWMMLFESENNCTLSTKVCVFSPVSRKSSKRSSYMMAMVTESSKNYHELPKIRFVSLANAGSSKAFRAFVSKVRNAFEPSSR
jgi:hypothetical protein